MTVFLSPPQYLSVNELEGYSLSYQAVLQPLTLAKYDQVRNILMKIGIYI